MDNITHTLIGVTLAQTVPQGWTKRDNKLVRAALWTAVIVSNFPDLDFLMKPFIPEGNLGYLLHHRGYTHTLLATIPMAAAAAWLGGRIADLKKAPPRWLYGLGLVGALFHLIADSWNDYGIHPFSPLSNRWFYGDSIFIMEPLLWFSMLPLAVQSAKSRWSARIWMALGVLMLATLWIGPFVPWAIAAFATLWLAGTAFAQHRWKGVIPTYGAATLVLCLFALASQQIRARVLQTTPITEDSDQLLQVITTPAPANPLCWRTLVAQKTKQDRYRVQIGVGSLAPNLFDPKTCYFHSDTDHLAPLLSGTVTDTAAFHWVGRYEVAWAELKRLESTNCHFAALMRFARAPFWTSVDGQPVGGDLRYDFEKGLGFAKLPISEDRPCSGWIPPWSPPLWTGPTR